MLEFLLLAAAAAGLTFSGFVLKISDAIQLKNICKQNIFRGLGRIEKVFLVFAWGPLIKKFLVNFWF